MLKFEPGKQLRLVMACCLLSAAMVGIGTTRAKAATADVDQLFQDAQAQAGLLAKDTDQMESYTNNDVGWEAYASEVDLIKKHINKLADIVNQLQAARGDTDSRHQTAIDRIVPLLQELASNTTAIIDHLNQDRQDLRNPSYQEYLKENTTLASNIYKVISDTVAYDSTKDKIEKLQVKLAKEGNKIQ